MVKRRDMVGEGLCKRVLCEFNFYGGVGEGSPHPGLPPTWSSQYGQYNPSSERRIGFSGFINVQRTQRFCFLQNCLNLSFVCGSFRNRSSLGTGLDGGITESPLTQAKQDMVATIKKGVPKFKFR